jgi:predicted ester cyclase
MSTAILVDSFYSRIWNDGDLTASSELLSKDFCFRGSLGVEMRGYDAFGEYVRSVRTALADFRCEILDCVTEQNKAFAKMRFTGIHVGTFRGHKPTGRPVHWLGAAFFTLEGGVISELWVLGDLVGLDAVLEMNAAPSGANNMQV